MKSGRQRLRDWMHRSKMNQRESAKVLGVDPVVLNQWLHGVRTPGLDNAVLLERVTGISVESWLLTAEHNDEGGNATATSKR